MALFSLRGIEYIIAFVTFPYLLHVLGPSKFGAITFVQSLITYGNIITDFGFNLTAPRDISQADEKQIPRHFSSILIAKIILLLLVIILGSILLYCFNDQIDIVLIICVIPSLIGNVLFPSWYYQGIQQMKFITIFNIIAKGSSVFGIFWLVNDSNDYCIAALLQAITPLLAGILSLLMLTFTNRELFCCPSLNDIREKYQDGWDIFISTVFINLYTNSNVVILKILTNDTCVGYYSAASKIIDILKGVLTPISNAIFPHVSALVQKSQADAIIFLRKAVRIIGTISFVLSSIMFFMADFVVTLIMGSDYNSSVEILRIISCLPFIIALSNVFGIQTMVSFGMQRVFSRILMLSSVINFLLVFPMVYYAQAVGMAVTTVIVECFVTLSMYCVLNRKGIKLIR